MAEEDEQKPKEISLSEQLLAEEEQDPLFKAQMAVANFFLGYWKHMVGVLAAILLGVLIYGFYDDYTRGKQLDIHEKIALAESGLNSQLLQGYGYGIAIPPGEEQTDGAEKLSSAGTALQAVADESEGVGATYARLRAASVFKASGRADLAMAVLEQASADEVEGVLSWSAQSQLAAIKATRGDVDGAVSIYQSFSAEGDDAIVQEALYSEGRVYYDNGRTDEAIQVWQNLLTTYPAYWRAGDLGVLISEHQISG